MLLVDLSCGRCCFENGLEQGFETGIEKGNEMGLAKGAEMGEGMGEGKGIGEDKRLPRARKGCGSCVTRCEEPS